MSNVIKIGAILLFIGAFFSWRFQAKEPAFIFDHLPQGAIVDKKHFSGTPKGDFLLLIKVKCSQAEFEQYLKNLKIDPQASQTAEELPWDISGVAWWDLPLQQGKAVKW